MNIYYSDHYTNDEHISNLNTYIDKYKYYKKHRNISMYLLEYDNIIKGIFCYEKCNNLCKILLFEILIHNKANSNEFIYFIGDIICNNFERLIFIYINNKILKLLYDYILKYQNYIIYDIDQNIIKNFSYVIDYYESNFYEFCKYKKFIRNSCFC